MPVYLRNSAKYFVFLHQHIYILNVYGFRVVGGSLWIDQIGQLAPLAYWVVRLHWSYLLSLRMRNKDDRNEFKEQQDAEIMDAYRRIFKIYGGKVDVHTLYKMVAFAPASRFFVSPRQAYRVIIRMMSGQPITNMRLSNQRMYREIHRRVQEELSQLSHNSQPSQSSLKSVIEKIVCQPAPEMYVGIRQISFIISKEKRKCYEERKRRLRHCF